MADKNTVPNLDKARSRLINAARLLVDAGCDPEKAEPITLGALADLGLRSVSPGVWVVAVEAFEQLALTVAAFDVRAEVLGVDTDVDGFGVETRITSDDWNEPLTVLGRAINSWLDYLIEYGLKHGGPIEVPLQVSMPAGFTIGDTAFLNRLSSFMDRVS